MYTTVNPAPRCLVLALAISSGLWGCATPGGRAERLERFISHLDLGPTYTAWLRAKLASDDEEYLASVTVVGGSDVVEIRKRYVLKERLVCDRAGSETMPDWQRLYEVDDPDAIAMYRNLFDQAMAGYTYVLERDTRYGGDAHRDYVIAWGPSCVITTNDGGRYDSFVYPLMEALVRLGDEDDDVDVRDYAEGIIDCRHVPSFATYVVMALDYFDEACTWYYTGDSGF